MTNSRSSSINEPTKVFIVGPRWPQHSRHSGYDGFHSYVGTYLRPPVLSRWPWANNAMQRVEPYPRYIVSEFLSWILTKISRRTYSWPIMRIELSAAKDMFRRRGAVYHIIYGETDFWFLGWIARLTRNYLVVSFHDGEKVLKNHGISSLLLSKVDGIFLLGKTQFPFFSGLVSSEKIHIIPHGVDPDFFCPNPLKNKEKMVITVGGHTRDYETFTTAVLQVWAVDPTVRFVAVSPNIGNLGRSLDLEGIEYRSNISDRELLQLYQTASVAAFSFEWAIANNSVLEAMAVGVPIVATDIGGVKEYVSEESGLLFPPGNGKAMAEAILLLLNNPNLVSKLGAGARASAIKLSYKSVSEDMLEAYLRVKESRKAKNLR